MENLNGENLYRYLVIEYCFCDNETFATRNVLGAYRTYGEARKEAGLYIKRNVRRMKQTYRDWEVRVQKDRVFFPITKGH